MTNGRLVIYTRGVMDIATSDAEAAARRAEDAAGRAEEAAGRADVQVFATYAAALAYSMDNPLSMVFSEEAAP